MNSIYLCYDNWWLKPMKCAQANHYNFTLALILCKYTDLLAHILFWGWKSLVLRITLIFSKIYCSPSKTSWHHDEAMGWRLNQINYDNVISVVPAFLTIPNYLSLSLTPNTEVDELGKNITVWKLGVNWNTFLI